ncbi:kinase-like domain-containing protein [Cytidiella melzeri]|nr:kinase-like domain-containing protein [Cytidiella melzeri]
MLCSHSNSPSPPPIGALIDNGALELVEILGYGGYGIVYRAIDTYSSHPTSYAVKCLPHSNKRSSTRQRQLHIREITLHQLASAHPGVVTLHRVIEDSQYTWIVMDYCGDGDLFTQILHNRRYLGQNDLIREVFLQLLDAVDYCHSLNIYHRDLKPENILCFDDGLRLAVTDFGLATTEKMSTEFRTGSVYHMSPECQGGEFAPTKSYSPLFNDIWSLGIILLNLITGRNPWKSASIDDCTFQAYLRDPVHFLPTVLPISQEVNALLVRVLHVDWRHRITLREMRQAVKEIRNFYSPDVLFEDSMARCPWEAGVNVDDDDEEAEGESTGPATETEPKSPAQDFLSEDVHRQSQWSGDSDSEMVFTANSPAQYSWEGSSYNGEESADIYHGRSASPASPLFSRRRFDDVRTASGPSTYSVVSSSPSIPSPPVTPGPDDSLFPDVARRPAHLTLDIDSLHTNYYDGSINMLSAESGSVMQTAIESARYTDFGPYSSFFYAESDKPSAIAPTSDEMRMIISPTDYDFDDEEMDTLSSYSYSRVEEYDVLSIPEPMSARPESPVLGLNLDFPSDDSAVVESQPEGTHAPDLAEIPSEAPAQDPAYSFLTFNSPDSSFKFPPLAAPIPFTPISTTLGSPFEYTPPASSTFSSKAPSSRQSRSRSRKSRLLNPMRLAFTRRSRSPTPSAPRSSFPPQDESPKYATHWTLSPSSSPEQQSLSCFATPAASPKVTGSSVTSTAVEKRDAQGIRRRTTKKKLRSPRDWFSPGRLLAAVIPSP